MVLDEVFWYVLSVNMFKKRSFGKIQTHENISFSGSSVVRHVGYRAESCVFIYHHRQDAIHWSLSKALNCSVGYGHLLNALNVNIDRIASSLVNILFWSGVEPILATLGSGEGTPSMGSVFKCTNSPTASKAVFI